MARRVLVAMLAALGFGIGNANAARAFLAPLPADLRAAKAELGIE